MSTIPASDLVQVTPSVLSAGGTAVQVIGLMLTDSTQVPIGSVASFASATAVEEYFGASSVEARKAGIYFEGFEGRNKSPSNVLFAQFNPDDVAAYLRGGDVSALTLAQLQAIAGSLTVVADGVSRPAASVNLSAAVSFSSAAGIIQTALNAAIPAAASVTGSIGGVVTASAGAAFTGTGSGTNLTTSSVVGVLHAGAAITGTGVPAGTYIVSQTSGATGGAGVYVTNHATTSAGDALVATSNTLDVTAVSSGTIHATDVVSGTGVTAGTVILAQISGAPGGIGLYTIDSAQHVASTAVTSLSTVLNVTAVISGTIEVGAVLSGTNVTSGTIVEANGTGSGGVGTYVLSAASTTVSETIAATAAAVGVTYDSVSGGFVIESGTTGTASTMGYATGTISDDLKLILVEGAVLSQGAAASATAAGAAAFMNGILNVTQSWVTYMATFDPDEPGENEVKLALSAWKNTQNDRFAYVCVDTDESPTVSVPATASMGKILQANGDSGTCLLWQPDYTTDKDAFICGTAASIDFEQTNGRVDFCFRRQNGLTADVTTQTAANNLGGAPQTSDHGNNYNFYGVYGSGPSAADPMIWFQRGFVTGEFAWFDSYINQVWLNSSFQQALLNLQANSRSIPYSIPGAALVESALADPIKRGLNFGAFGPGTISDSQAAQVNAAAGMDVRRALETQGYYLQVKQASSAVRAARTSPPCTFWYLDRGSVQAFNLASIAIQ